MTVLFSLFLGPASAMRCILLVLLVVYLGGAHALSLRSLWGTRATSPRTPIKALLFASCSVSADSKTLQGTASSGTSTIVCSSDTASYAIGCLTEHNSYMCNGATWTSS
jgi:hypothetical protein